MIHLQELRKERPLVTAGESCASRRLLAGRRNWANRKSDSLRRLEVPKGSFSFGNRPLPRTAAPGARFVTRGGAVARMRCFLPRLRQLLPCRRHEERRCTPVAVAADDSQANPATVTHVDQLIESSGRTVNVLVDFDNPKDGETRGLTSSRRRGHAGDSTEAGQSFGRSEGSLRFRIFG